MTLKNNISTHNSTTTLSRSGLAEGGTSSHVSRSFARPVHFDSMVGANRSQSTSSIHSNGGRKPSPPSRQVNPESVFFFGQGDQQRSANGAYDYYPKGVSSMKLKLDNNSMLELPFKSVEFWLSGLLRGLYFRVTLDIFQILFHFYSYNTKTTHFYRWLLTSIWCTFSKSTILRQSSFLHTQYGKGEAFILKLESHTKGFNVVFLSMTFLILKLALFFVQVPLGLICPWVYLHSPKLF